MILFYLVIRLMLFSNYSLNTQAEAQDSFLIMLIHIMSVVLGILGYPSDALNSDTEINCDCLLPGDASETCIACDTKAL